MFLQQKSLIERVSETFEVFSHRSYIVFEPNARCDVIFFETRLATSSPEGMSVILYDYKDDRGR